MPAYSEEYQHLVLDDLKTYVGLTEPVRAGFWERLLKRKLPLGRLHPNPDDEFCNPEIGPSGNVIDNYVQTWKQEMKHTSHPDMEPLFVEKMSVGDYMLLDGHHRWYAAHRMGLDWVRVRVLNVTPVDQLLASISSSQRNMCVSFDLDEVLLTGSKQDADKRNPMAFHHYLKKTMRKNSPALIKQLQELGFDVWVYSSGYMPEDSLRKLFRYHGVTVDGIMNGFRNTQTREAIHKAITENYEVTVHIDNEGILCVDTATREYDLVDVHAGDTDWSAKSFAAVKSHPIVLKHLKRK